MSHESWWGGGMMWIIWIPILIVLVLLVYRMINNEAINKSDSETPMDILKKRYAKGEITKEEFEERKRTLQ